MNLKFYKKSYMEKYDIVVVGSGNAALCAASVSYTHLRAHET